MRSVLFEQFGNPSDVLTLGERSMPEPGPGEVRLKLLLSPIHNHDLAIIRGQYGYKPPLPAVPGTEAVASVDALGEGVTHLKVGQRVAIAGVQATWAEFFVAKAAGAVPMPDAIANEAACQLLAMPMSASMLVEDLALQSGEWMIQNTANGAVGRIVNVLAKARGFHVINLVRSAEAARTLQEDGVPNVLSTDAADWASQVNTLTGGAPVVRGVDSLGGRAANALMNVMGYGSTLVSFGAMTGEPLAIDVGNVIFKQAVVRGFWGAKRSETTSSADKARMIGELMQLVISGALPLKVAESYELADAARAAAASATPNRAGKIAIRGA